jgi:hypothetical protein
MAVREEEDVVCGSSTCREVWCTTVELTTSLTVTGNDLTNTSGIGSGVLGSQPSTSLPKPQGSTPGAVALEWSLFI